MEYAKFTPQMKQTHTLLIPVMLPIHFELLSGVLQNEGYKTECLHTDTQNVINEGLKNVHNDTCYPALLVIGQFIDALKSGKYDPDKVALMITQTGGGCRASNYIHLLRKALAKTFPQVPVISINFSGFEIDKNSGFKLTYSMMLKFGYAVFYGDLLMSLYNQVRPYEINQGEGKKVLQEMQKMIIQSMKSTSFLHFKRRAKNIIKAFNTVELNDIKKKKVGIVGEIYVKYSPLANNHLEEFLLKEGFEPVVPALMDFVLYCVDSSIYNDTIYGRKTKKTSIFKLVYKILYRMQKKLNYLIKKKSKFEEFHDFEKLKKAANKYISQGVVMGEGWLIPAEMALLVESHCPNIVATQPFGCLPNHIVSKGMMRVIKENYPGSNIVAIDYDPGATKVNQENRIKLMLETAKK